MKVQNMSPSTLDSLVSFFENISPESITEFPRYYADDAYFKDPFNEVRGIPAIQHIFMHMFRQVAEPRFSIIDRVVDENGALLVWEFHYRAKLWGGRRTQIIRGATHLRLNAEGKVIWHRDYWDAAEELYAKLPLIGGLIRGLQRACSG